MPKFKQFVVWGAALYVVVMIVALTMFLTSYLTVSSAIFGAIIAILPVPVYLFLILMLDRMEIEPPWMLLVAFSWGASASVGLSLYFNTLLDKIFANQLSDDVSSAVIAPIVEESFKAMVLFVFFFTRRKEFDSIIDGIIYATVVGLGFAMSENILYYASGFAADQALSMFFIRGVMSPYAHPLFTSLVGITLGWSLIVKNKSFAKILPIIGLIFAILLHSAWNGSTLLGNHGFHFMYYTIFIPELIFIVLLISWETSRIKKVILDNLDDFNTIEKIYISNQKERFKRVLFDLFKKGPKSAMLRIGYNQASTNLAIYRHRTALKEIEDDRAYSVALMNKIDQYRKDMD
jgi:RsiW-degrading membrane proteinase PrsW (M82 family)|tara:strand:+ start:352 stop:1395 length:1044 start_codon:yes stop_codon:yes gene_type:complete